MSLLSLSIGFRFSVKTLGVLFLMHLDMQPGVKLPKDDDMPSPGDPRL